MAQQMFFLQVLSILLGALVCTSHCAADAFLQVLSMLLGAFVCILHIVLQVLLHQLVLQVVLHEDVAGVKKKCCHCCECHCGVAIIAAVTVLL